MYKILVSDKLGSAGLEMLEAAPDASVTIKIGMSKDELIAVIPEFDALLIRSGTTVDADVLRAAARLKVVGRAGIGVDNVDISTATEQGVIVMNTPAANSIATAELTMALMLAASRHVTAAHVSLAAGEWNRSAYVGTELYGKTLGIFGFGRIGRLVAARAQAFGMSVLATDPYVSEEVAQQLDVTLVDLDELLPLSDYVTLHSNVTFETANVFNDSTIPLMKEGAVLINVARGKLIDQQALRRELDSGRIRAAALDVFPSEPPADNPLIGHPAVIHTPHLGASTKEAQRAVATEIVSQVLDALRGKDFRNAINIPFPPGIDFMAAQPYLSLAEKIGLVHAGIAPAPIKNVEIGLSGEALNNLIRPVAAALLKGVLTPLGLPKINIVNAPVLADANGISMTETGQQAAVDFTNMISCRVQWEGGERTLAGVLFGGSEPRIVQVDNYSLEIRPDGILLVLRNQDIPGVVGQIGTILAAYDVNIGEWRMGRTDPGGEALSFITLDSEPPAEVLDALRKVKPITGLTLMKL